MHAWLGALVGSERFLREIQSSPSSIILIFSRSTTPGCGRLLYYVMPYVEGESLRDRLKRDHQLPLDEALRIAGRLPDRPGLTRTSTSVVHRDIKPRTS